ncbi:MAG: hypothetical protein QM771_05935 [Nitrospira sp.]
MAPASESDLPEGEYVVAYRGFHKGQWFGQRKICLRFEVVEPSNCAGIQVSLFSTFEPSPSSRTKYYTNFVKANGGIPRRGDRMSPKVFKGYWRAIIAWNSPKNGGHSMPQVTELIERVAGGTANGC